MGAIVWLASYPKSGNTWVRTFLTNYIRGSNEPADINDLDGGPIASSRGLFDRLVGVEASDLTPDEIGRYRCAAYRRLASESDRTLFLKVHDAYRRSADTAPLFPPDVTRLAIYIMRNPLDVAVSLAHHQGISVDCAVSRLCTDTSLSAKPGRLSDQLEQMLRTWSGHVGSWVDEPGLPVHVVRYEDMIVEPQQTFAAMVRACGLSVDDRLDRAIAFSRFDALRAQEQEKGFVERPSSTETFFREGRAGGWRRALTLSHIRQLVEHQGGTMRRYGYIEHEVEKPTHDLKGERL